MAEKIKILRLRDNRFGVNGRRFERHNDNDACFSDAWEGFDSLSLSKTEKGLLERFGGQTLSELAQSDAVVDLSGSHLLGKDDLCFFGFHGEGENCFRLDTGNLMGALCFRDHESGAALQVEILSRFDTGNNNHFLNYLLSKVMDVAIGYEPVIANQSSVLNLLLDVLFVRRFGEASKNGLLRQYRTFRNNDWNFKGCLDLPRHLRENVPFQRGIAYVKREIALDVPVNRLLFHAALVVHRRHPDLFEGNEDARDALRALQTGIADPGDLRTVLSYRDCREPIIHPFFRETWEPLRRIARMILEEERWQMFQESADDEVSGIVFDGAWLWEEYVATVLVPAGFRHCERGGSTGLHVLRDGGRRFYPDFISLNKNMVLDTKYKRSNPNGGRDDVHQVLCYLLLSGAKLGGLIFPPVDERLESTEDRDGEFYVLSENGGWSEKKPVNSPYSTDNHTIHWSCFSWAAVPKDGAWDGFCGYMEEQEQGLVKNLNEI